MANDLETYLETRGFTLSSWVTGFRGFRRYEKKLRDRTILAYFVDNESGGIIVAHGSLTAGECSFTTVEELELGLIYQSLRTP